MQGCKSKLEEEVYGLPPEDVRQSLRMAPHEILRIATAVYGLLNAPKRWYESLSKCLIDDGWNIHYLDECLFKRVNQNNVVCGYLGVHVDDVISAGHGLEYEQSLGRLRANNAFETWETPMEHTVQYCGCELKQEKDFTITVHQQKFALGIEEVPISAERKLQLDSKLSFGEQSQMRQRFRSFELASCAISTVASFHRHSLAGQC